MAKNTTAELIYNTLVNQYNPKSKSVPALGVNTLASMTGRSKYSVRRALTQNIQGVKVIRNNNKVYAALREGYAKSRLSYSE